MVRSVCPGHFCFPAMLECTPALPCLPLAIQHFPCLALLTLPNIPLHTHALPLTCLQLSSRALPCLALPVSAWSIHHWTYPPIPTTSGPSLTYHSICFPLTALALPTFPLTCLQLPTHGLHCLAFREGKAKSGRQSKARSCR